MSEKKKELIRTLKFILFSASAAIVEIVSYAIFFDLIHFEEWLAHLVSLILSVVWNFTLNRKFTFCSANNVPIAMLKVAGFYLVFTPLSTWWTAVLTGASVGWNAYAVLVMTMLINLVTEYLYCKYFVFKGSIDSAKK